MSIIACICLRSKRSSRQQAERYRITPSAYSMNSMLMYMLSHDAEVYIMDFLPTFILHMQSTK